MALETSQILLYKNPIILCLMRPNTKLAWASEPCLLGIDEAGRGPVLGPMVYGIAFCPLHLQNKLKGRAFADSKTLSEERREELFQEIEEDEFMSYNVDSVSAKSISAQMLRSDKVSLNAIANASTIRLLEKVVEQGYNIKEVYCDTVGDATRWQQTLVKHFPAIRFTVCPKADALYPIVSAASIAAKVTRDRELKTFRHEEGISGTSAYGSGYPADPITVAWLKSNLHPVFGFPSLVRFSWSTTVKILEEKAVKVSWESEEGLDAQQRTLSFGSKAVATGASSGLSRHSYFQSRKLQRVFDF